MFKKIKSLFQLEANAISNIPIDENYGKAISIIHNHVHNLNGKLITTGMGKAGQIAHNIATTFSSTGTPAVFIHPSEAQHGDLGLIQKNDALLLISNSGKTTEIVDFVTLANQLYDKKLPIISITGNLSSDLASLSSCILFTGNPEENCPIGLTPTVSTTVMNVIGNTLVILMMEKIKFNKLDYSKRHHGGYLGSISRKD